MTGQARDAAMRLRFFYNLRGWTCAVLFAALAEHETGWFAEVVTTSAVLYAVVCGAESIRLAYDFGKSHARA